MQKTFLCILFTIILSITLFADLPTKPIKQQTIECVRVNEPIIIDGQYDKVWSKAIKYYMYEIESLNAPLSTGVVMTMYDNENIYVFLKAKDKDIMSLETKADENTCYDDVLEVFLRPGKNCPWYYNAEINALGTALTAKNHVGGGGSGKRWTNMWNPNLDYKVFLKGTINNCKDIDEYWTLEIKIPFSELDALKGKVPQKGDVWTCNFAKYDFSIYLAEKGGTEMATVCHTTTQRFHELSNYCPLIFK